MSEGSLRKGEIDLRGLQDRGLPAMTLQGGGMRKPALLFIMGCIFASGAPFAWAQGTALTPEGYNAMLEAHGLKLVDPRKCPPEFVTTKEGQNIFGTQAVAYTPAQYNAILEAYGLRLEDPKKCPPDFVTATEGKYIFESQDIAYPDYKILLEAYGVKVSK